MENETSNNKIKYLLSAIMFVAVAVAGGSAYYYSRSHSGDDKQKSANILQNEGVITTETPQDTTIVQPTVSTDTVPSSEVKTFTVVGTKNMKFSVNEIKVHQGDKVKIVFQNDGGFHDWVLDEFNVKTPRIQAGQSAEVEFIADKTGTFEYYCSVGSHRAAGMKGNLIVE